MASPDAPVDQSLPTAFNRLLGGYVIGRAIHVAAELGVADALAGGARSTTDLAAVVGAEPHALYRLLRALASVGLFSEVAPGSFALTPLGSSLRSDMPGTLRDLAQLHGSAYIRRALDGLLENVQTGRSAFETSYGMPLYAYLEAHPEDAAIFDAAMTSVSSMETAAVLAAYDFAGVHTLVDVGGGQGSLLTVILSAHPAMRGILFDRPSVAAGARQELERAGMADRCEVVAGDFFVGVPGGGDAYLLKNIIHNWDDEQAVAILRRCRQALAAKGTLLVVQPLIPPGDVPSPNKITDLLMLVAPGGRERTEEEHQKLLVAAGFALTRVVPTASRMSIVEATPLPDR